MDVASYLAGLPAGLASYPECQAKVAVARSFVERLEQHSPELRLDPDLRAAVEGPVSAWLPETASTAIFLAARGAFAGDEPFLRWVEDADRELLSGRLYRALFWLVGPKRVLRAGAERWERLHRGTTLHLEHMGDHDARARLTYPYGLFPPLAIAAYAGSFRVALELAGAARCACSVHEQTPTHALFVAHWDDH